MTLRLILSASLLMLLSGCRSAPTLPNVEAKAPGTLRIAFGSCNSAPASKIWGAIEAARPDLLLFLGDNIYLNSSEWLDEYAVRRKYQTIFSEPGAARLLAAVPTYAIWDDHDFGPNNSDGDFPGAAATRRAFDAFWRNPPGPPELADGIAFSIVRSGVEILMTDNRSYRRHFRRNSDPAFFGAKQLQWIRSRFRDSAAEVIVIASGTQLLSSDGNGESLDAYPEEQNELFKIFAEFPRPVIVISGDLHYGQALSRPIARREIVEITSSPLTADVRSSSRIKRRHEPYSKAVVVDQNFGLLEISTGQGSPRGVGKIVDREGQVRIEQQLFESR